MATEYLIISVPNEGGGKQATWSSLASLLNEHSECYPFDVPTLRTATLDRLMKAADLLTKLDLGSESIVRKVEKQFNDLLELKFNYENSIENLEVEEMPVLQYIENFNWNSAKYPLSRHIDELLKSIGQQMTRLEEELKESSIFFNEKKSTYQSIQRKLGQAMNLSFMDIDELIPKETILERNLVDSEYLKDVAVLVPKNQEKLFLTEYDSLAKTAVNYNASSGTSNDKVIIPGSPVVPFSASKVKEDNEYCLYTMRILRNFVNQVKRDALPKRYIIKQINFKLLNPNIHLEEKSEHDHEDGKHEKDNEISLEEAESELEIAVAQLKRWCHAHYGEAFVGWMHVKAMRVFTESALRYGIPANFASMILKPKRGKTKTRKVLFDKFKVLDEHGMMSDQGQQEGHINVTGVGLEGELYPYVSFDFNPFGQKER